ncbi:O-acetyl-ADP-ribose deacetylase [Peptococcaceae bacterium CEB3]|nr:O-acetyl-ADP-ribose deacetylase [Peptococcaceae bacterium CEB3]
MNEEIGIFSSKRVEIRQEDITKVAVDAIVNAANNSLLGGGGVDGAIHKAGGPAILEECRRINKRQGGCETGEAVITTGGNLPAKYVIHTVGPVWYGGKQGESEKLRSCYRNSLKLARENGIESIAFPNISTGVYGYPKEEAARLAIDEIRNFLQNKDRIKKVLFVCYDRENYEIYCRLAEKLR